jgi:membrane fusion protein, multidrug efflux system
MTRECTVYLRNLTSYSLALGLTFALACSNKQRSPTGGGPGGGRPPAPVVVAAVEQRDIPVQIRAIGNVEPYQTVQIRSQVNGEIERVYFKEGQEVRKGDSLFTLDKRPFQADLEKAIGTLQHDEAQAANSQAQAARYSALEQQGVISREQADQMRTQATADASAVNADRATVNAARVQLQYTDIKAPIDARTGALLINQGNLVKANDTPFLVQLNQITPIYATFSVPETYLDQVRKYSSGHLTVLAFPKGSTTDATEGALSFLDNTVDTQTGTVKLKATFANKDRRLWPGEFVDVVVNLSVQKNAIAIPTKAVQTGQQGQYVYVVTQQNTAESRVVTTTGTYQNLTMISKGVSPGERVIVEGQLRVAPNSQVVVQSTLPPSTSSAATAAPGAVVPGGGL